MSIVASPLACGSAVRLIVSPPAGARYWRLLRGTVAPTGPDDQAATVLASCSTVTDRLDWQGLTDGTPYSYAVYYWDGAEWSAPDTAQATPAQAMDFDEVEPVSVLLERFRKGVAAELTAARIQVPSGEIKVVSSPLMSDGRATWPMVVIHLNSSTPFAQFVGDEVRPPTDNGDGTVSVWKGEIYDYNVTVSGWSPNEVERLSLRKMLWRIFEANRLLLADLGFMNATLSQRDSEDLEQKNCPLFISEGVIAFQMMHWTAEIVPKLQSITVKSA
ncbi:hypothetical protein LDL36_20495 [Komagataeibacter sp. FNDCR1]|nr:hypothetical protein [Komagataeibacter sp. FNDCR1]